jgi:hypothetical protein
LHYGLNDAAELFTAQLTDDGDGAFRWQSAALKAGDG